MNASKLNGPARRRGALKPSIVGVIALLSASMGCTETIPVTQVVLSIETDIAYPATIDEIQATVRSPSGRTRVASAVLGFGQAPPPRTLAITHGDGEAMDYEVEVEGLFRGTTVVSRTLRFDMSQDVVMQVDASLDAACIGVTCEGELTCIAGSCEAADVSPFPFNGGAMALTSDAGVAAP